MKHLRKDYDPIQDPRLGGIGADEPVFLLRAKDLVAPKAVRAWAIAAAGAGTDSDVVDAVMDWARVMEEWQREHGSKVPDVPEGALRAPEPEEQR